MRRSLISLVTPVITLAFCTVLAAPAAAQFGRVPETGQAGRDPTWWGSVWGGYQWSNPVSDNRSAAIWRFDSGWGFRGTLERELGGSTAIGVAFNYVRMPLSFRGFATPGGGTACASGCEATATMASYGLVLRNGGGRGLHPVVEGFLGAMQFNNFDFDVASEAPSGEISNTDLAFSVGAGFGYSLSRDFQVIALYDIGRNVHERSNQTFGANRITQHYATRVGLRVGF